MYDVPGHDQSREWIEIYNKGSSSVEIITGGGSSSWRFSDGLQHTLTVTRGSNTLLANSYAVIVDNTLRFVREWPNFSGTILESSVSLNNVLDDVTLLSSKNGQVLDKVTYYSSQGAAGDGNSLQIQENSSWAGARPTPGGANSSLALVQTKRDLSSDTISSTHYSSSALSDSGSTLTFDIGAGRERIGSVGTPMEFSIETSIDSSQHKSFLWNFGDGTEAGGSVLSHTYKYPGNYVVILKSSFRKGEEATSRIDVKIIDPKLSVIYVDDTRIDIKNGSEYEVNLFGRALVVGEKFFIFPKDTIIKSDQVLSFGSEVTGLAPQSLYDVFFVVLGDTEHPQFKAKIEEEKLRQISNIKNQINILQQKIGEIVTGK